jgi:hypothetical protein
LKGTALNLSANRIAARAALLSESGRQQDYEKVEDLIQELKSDVVDFENYLQKNTWWEEGETAITDNSAMKIDQ